MSAATETYSLDISVIAGIRALAERFGKKQGEIVKDMYYEYLKSLDDEDHSDLDDDALAVVCEARLERSRSRGEKMYTQEEVEAIVNAA
ncbi:MAG: hypothetical protein LBC09_02260 [Helicobacteraceae bacterium]|jgi:hypothetical protein|nr:hypothetical protein [Helicobacteraceae bacterium]